MRVEAPTIACQVMGHLVACPVWISFMSLKTALLSNESSKSV